MSTLKDIANACGVSTATVSYVMNSNCGTKISEETRAKVLAVAKRLRYEPNGLARSMRTGNSKVIALITFDRLGAEYFYTIFNGICQVATNLGYSLKVYEIVNNGDQVLQMLVEQRIAGVLVSASDFSECRDLALEFQSRNIPVVAVNCRATIPACPSFLSDDRQGAREAVRCLVQAGCKKIACVSHPGNFSYLRLREEGFYAAMAEFAPDQTPLLLKRGSEDIHSQDDCPIGNLLANPEQRPDGFFCVSDGHAFFLYQLAYKLQLRIPQDFSVIGFGNLSYSNVAMIPLTTISQPFAKMGQQAASALIAVVNGKTKQADGIVEFQNELLLRDSVRLHT